MAAGAPKKIRLRCVGCAQPLYADIHGTCRLCDTHNRRIFGRAYFTASGAARQARREGYPDLSDQIRRHAGAAAAPPTTTWQDAEREARNWMAANGFRDATVTRAGADGGVDIRSRKAVAQVKYWSKPCGIRDVQRIAGVAAAEGKRALVFSRRGFTKAASEWGEEAGVALFRVDPVTELNRHAKQIRRTGFAERFR